MKCKFKLKCNVYHIITRVMSSIGWLVDLYSWQEFGILYCGVRYAHWGEGGEVRYASLESPMGMKCYRSHFLSLGIWGWVANPLPFCLIFPPTAYFQCTQYNRVCWGDKWYSNLESNFSLTGIWTPGSHSLTTILLSTSSDWGLIDALIVNYYYSSTIKLSGD